MSLEAAISAWQALLGTGRVLTGNGVSQAYGSDCTGSRREVPVALRPQDRAEVASVVRIAHQYGLPVYPISTGHNWGYGSALPARNGCALLDLSGLDRIVAFDAELGVVTLEPGVTQQMLSDFLDGGGHPYMVPTTGAGPHCSLLGNALERGFGVTPVADHFAAVTDIEAVLADGSTFRTALRELAGDDLARLFKWGIGPYSPGLFTQGNFGVVTQMSIVLARRPACVKVALFSLAEDNLLERGVDAVQRALSGLPGLVGGINLMNQHRVLAMAAPYPLDRGAPLQLIPEPLVQQLGRQYQILPWTGFGSLYGSERTVKAAQREMAAVLRGTASRLVFVSPRLAQRIRQLSGAVPGALGQRLARTAGTLEASLALVAGRPSQVALPLAHWLRPRRHEHIDFDPSRDGAGLIWYAPLVPMRPALVRRFVAMVQEVTARFLIEPLITLTSLNERLFECTIPLLYDAEHPTRRDAAHGCYDALLTAGQRLGVYPYRLGVDAMHHYNRASPLASTFHARLRQGIDPQDILSPGRYAPVADMP